jgi:hypothetical protein
MITHTAGDKWEVTGYPYTTRFKDDTPAYNSTIPSANGNIVVSYDNPALNFSDLASGAPKVGDYIYQKSNFVYTLTKTVGAASSIRSQNVGVVVLSERININNTSAASWTNLYYYASTTNFPDCSGVTMPEIRNIVKGTAPIIIKLSADQLY